MRLGLMQPYFFPYLGYFDLINSVDLWVAFDTVQYIRRGWMNRNRILHPKEGWTYITAPVAKHPRETLIKDIWFADEPWKERIKGQLSHYKGAPFYREVLALLDRCFKYNGRSLLDFNLFSLYVFCEYLGIRFNYRVLSLLGLDLGPIEKPSDWAIQLCKALRFATYVNAPGGVETGIYSADEFERHGIELLIAGRPPMVYGAEGRFIPHLSILDVLMWNDPQAIKEYLDA